MMILDYRHGCDGFLPVCHGLGLFWQPHDFMGKGVLLGKAGFAPLPTLRGPSACSAASPQGSIARAKPALERRLARLKPGAERGIDRWTLTQACAQPRVDSRLPEERMGHVHQRITLSAEKAVTVRMLVDTGATFSVIPEALARAVGVKRLRRSVAITLADGRRVKLDAGTAIFRIGDREAPATILVGDVAEPILGVETLEALGLTVDPRKRRLTPSRQYAVRLGGYR